MAIVRFGEIHAHGPINKAYEIRCRRSLLWALLRTHNVFTLD